MALITRRLTCSFNESVTFYFDQPVTQSIVGISRFSLSFGNADHEMLRVSLSLQVTPESNNISVTPQASMEDSSGHELDETASTITIVILAWTGVSPGTIAVGQGSALPNSEQGPSNGVQGPGTVLIAQALLTGFNFVYDAQHWVLQIGAAAAPSSNGELGYIQATASMKDSSGSTASTATINGTLLLASNSAPGLVVDTKKTPNTTGLVPVPLSALPANYVLTDAAVFLSGFQVTYRDSGDHWVMTFGAGVTDWAITAADTV